MIWLPRAGPVRSLDFARAVYRNIESGDNGVNQWTVRALAGILRG